MERIGPLPEARKQLLAKIEELLSTARGIVADDVVSVEAGIEVLSDLRKKIYEDLNQIQHEALIIESAEWLEKNVLQGSPLDWYWNPRQTGTNDEPDLRCQFGASVIVAEATTSPKPSGLIDSRMASTLAKLSRMKGEQYYFVRTESMKTRAETKIAVGGWRIRAVAIA